MTVSKLQPTNHKASSAPLLGALYATLAAFFFSIMTIAIRIAAETIDLLEIAFFQSLFALLIMLPWLVTTGLSGLRTKRLGQHIWRAVFGLLAMICRIYSIKLLPLAEAVALNFTTPLFTTVGAELILGEIVLARRWSATAVGFLGVLIILRPGFADLASAMALPVAAAALMAGTALFVKSLLRSESSVVIVSYMSLFKTLLSLIPALFVWRWPDPMTFALLASIGILAAATNVAFTQAFARADALAILPFGYTLLPFVAVLSFVLFGQTVDLWTWTGAAVIAGSAIYLARRESLVTRARVTPVPDP